MSEILINLNKEKKSLTTRKRQFLQNEPWSKHMGHQLSVWSALQHRQSANNPPCRHLVVLVKQPINSLSKQLEGMAEQNNFQGTCIHERRSKSFLFVCGKLVVPKELSSTLPSRLHFPPMVGGWRSMAIYQHHYGKLA